MTIGDALSGFAVDASRASRQEANAPTSRVLSIWRGLDITSRFALTAAVVIGLGMLVLVWWVSGRIEAGVVEHAGASAAVMADSVVEPHLQSLARGSTLPESARTSLDTLLLQSHQPSGLQAISVWAPDGKLLYFSDREAGRTAPLFPGQSIKGVVAAYEAALPVPRLSVLMPMHDGANGNIIAIAKIERDARQLADQLARTSAETAIVTGLLSLAMVGVLLGIVRQANQTIAEQREALAERVTTLSELLDKNSHLQNKLLSVTRRSSETNDRALRRIGAELHDGPVQLIALSLLRIESVKRLVRAGKHDSDPDVDAIEGALRDALTEMRGISAGLALPRLEGTSVSRAVEYAVMNHEKRSRTRVRLELGDGLPDREEPSVLACLYRFTQECLNNAVRHAKGKGQFVRVIRSDDAVLLEVCDEGPGFGAPSSAPSGSGLGLIGLADRVQTLGGTFEAGNRPGGGARVAALLPLGAQRADVIDRPWGV